jgi:hypothetical protein
MAGMIKLHNLIVHYSEKERTRNEQTESAMHRSPGSETTPLSLPLCDLRDLCAMLF